MDLQQAIAAYKRGDQRVSRELLTAFVEKEIAEKYVHLCLQFYPDNCLQAKLSVPSKDKIILHHNPRPFLDILMDQGFMPKAEHDSEGWVRSIQYELCVDTIASLGHNFVLQAALGSNFISVWYRNSSQDWRTDLPIFYALEILNKLQARINQVVQKMDCADWGAPELCETRPMAANRSFG